MANPNPVASFKPGQSGNPNGRPKRDWTWSGVLEQAVQEQIESGGQIKEIVGKALVKECLKGNIQAIKELMNRMDGMPNQPTDLIIKEMPKPILGGESKSVPTK